MELHSCFQFFCFWQLHIICTFNFVLCWIIFMEDYIYDTFFLISEGENRAYLVCGCDFYTEAKGSIFETAAEPVGTKEKVFFLFLLIPLFPALTVSLLAKVLQTQDCCQQCSTILGSTLLHFPCGVAITVCERRSKSLWYHTALQFLVTAQGDMKTQGWGMTWLPLLSAALDQPKLTRKPHPKFPAKPNGMNA